MRLGTVFPQTDLGADPIAIKEFIQGIEDLGFDHLTIYDHVINPDPASRPEHYAPSTNASGNRPSRERRYGYKKGDNFLEAFTLLGFAASITSRLELVTEVLILPQRQTVLAAKQAATVDILSGGRFRLGVGVGYVDVEYEALGSDFHTRGARMDEQITLMRKLWTEPVVHFQGRWHHVQGAGFDPLPVQRPIPIWIGGVTGPAIERAAKLGDGWFPLGQADDSTRALLEKFRGTAWKHGRNPSAIGLEGRSALVTKTPDELHSAALWWKREGATHFQVGSSRMAGHNLSEYLSLLRRAIPAITV